MKTQETTLELIRRRAQKRGDTTARISLDQSRIRNALYFSGKQHFRMVGSSVTDIAPDENQVLYKANFIKSQVLRAVMKLMAQNGRFAVAPESGSARHREIARMSESVFQHLRTVTGYQREKLMALLWAAVTGSGFLRNTFDPTSGENQRFFWFSKDDHAVIPPEALSPDERQLRNREGLFDDRPRGEVRCESVPPMYVKEDPVSRDSIEHCRWIIIERWVDRSWIAERFGMDEDDIEVDDAGGSSGRWDDVLGMMNTAMQGRFYSTPTDERSRRNRAWLVEMYERPSREHKHGRYVVVAGSKVPVDGENPYVGDESGACHIPLVKFDWAPGLGRFIGLPLVDDLVNIQFRYNESRSRQCEYEELFSRIPTFVPKGSGIAPSGLEIKSHSVYEFNGSFGAIQFPSIPPMPAQVSENASRAAGEMRQLASQTDIDAGKLPGQLRSGLALNAIQQERDIVLDLSGMLALEGDAQVGRQFLGLAKLFYDDDRLISIRGSNGEWAVKAFKAADLRNDLRIIGEPGEFETTSQFQNRILDFVQSGALQPQTNPEHAQVILKALKFKTAEEIVTDFVQHEERQEEEIRRMIARPQAYADTPYPVMPFEDDSAHMRVLERLFNNLDEWDKLDPFAQSVLGTHWEMHNRAKEQKMAQQMQMAEAMKGSPGSKGLASQPSR